jgi:hypothetical protein
MHIPVSISQRKSPKYNFRLRVEVRSRNFQEVAEVGFPQPRNTHY